MGDCSQFKMRYYFDSFSQSCKKFFYSKLRKILIIFGLPTYYIAFIFFLKAVVVEISTISLLSENAKMLVSEIIVILIVVILLKTEEFNF